MRFASWILIELTFCLFINAIMILWSSAVKSCTWNHLWWLHLVLHLFWDNLVRILTLVQFSAHLYLLQTVCMNRDDLWSTLCLTILNYGVSDSYFLCMNKEISFFYFLVAKFKTFLAYETFVLKFIRWIDILPDWNHKGWDHQYSSLH